jgi:hypothetical protein
MPFRLFKKLQKGVEQNMHSALMLNIICSFLLEIEICNFFLEKKERPIGLTLKSDSKSSNA